MATYEPQPPQIRSTLRYASPSNHLAFGQQPSNAVAGRPINPAVTVLVLDQFGNVVSTDNSYVALLLGSELKPSSRRAAGWRRSTTCPSIIQATAWRSWRSMAVSTSCEFQHFHNRARGGGSLGFQCKPANALSGQAITARHQSASRRPVRQSRDQQFVIPSTS